MKNLYFIIVLFFFTPVVLATEESSQSENNQCIQQQANVYKQVVLFLEREKDVKEAEDRLNQVTQSWQEAEESHQHPYPFKATAKQGRMNDPKLVLSTLLSLFEVTVNLTQIL